MIAPSNQVARLDRPDTFADLERDDAVAQIRAWSRAGAAEAQIVVATRMGVEFIRRAIGGIVAEPRQ